MYFVAGGGSRASQCIAVAVESFRPRFVQRGITLHKMSIKTLLLLCLSALLVHTGIAVDFDLYEELGVEKDASKAEIKRAFRKQV